MRFMGLIAFLALAGVAVASPRFEVTISPSAHAQPITGRVFVILSKTDNPEPRFQAANWRASETPFFDLDVENLNPANPRRSIRPPSATRCAV
jgi:hypothetical protein